MALNKYEIPNFTLIARSTFNDRTFGLYKVVEIRRNPRLAGNAAYIAILKLNGSLNDNRLFATAYENVVRAVSDNNTYKVTSNLVAVERRGGAYAAFGTTTLTPSKQERDHISATMERLHKSGIFEGKVTATPSVAANLPKQADPGQLYLITGGDQEKPASFRDNIDTVLYLDELLVGMRKLAQSDPNAAALIRASLALI
jgi:hypothetical protein